MTEFKGKVALVTGAGRGIGRAVSQAFASQGASLALNDLTPVNLDQTVTLIQAAGGKVTSYIFDIAKKMPVEEMIDEVLRDWGRIDILVNNAGVHPRAALLDMDEWDLRRTVDVNLCGAFFTMQLAGRAMRQQGGGSIINIAAAEIHTPAWKTSSAFWASKAGLVGLTTQAANELAEYRIRVNAICPGLIETEGLKTSSADILADYLKNTSAGQLGRPEDVAELALYLCSAEASEITGKIFEIGGGLTKP